MTEYIVLARNADGFWIEEQIIEAASAEAAIRTGLKSTSISGSQSFVAVPARSWKPVSVTVETVQRVTLDGVEESQAPVPVEEPAAA